MREEKASSAWRLDDFPWNHPSFADALLAYPQTIFAALVWLGQERDALALAELTVDLALRARILCTIAQEWRVRADKEQREILPLLSQVQRCLASLQAHRRIDGLRGDLVEELAAWHQWSVAQEMIDSISEARERERTQWFLLDQMLKAGFWEEVLAKAPAIDDGLLLSLCEVCTRRHVWKPAEKAVCLIKETSRKIDGWRMLARELAGVSETSRAEAIFRQAVRAASETPVGPFTLASLSEDLARAHQWEMAEAIASLLLSPLAGAEERETEWQKGRFADEIWPPVLRSRVLATLAGQYTLSHFRERGGTLWEQARSPALSCSRPWHQTVALGHLTLCFAEAHLWECALDTWNQAEAIWQKARAWKEANYEEEERDRRLGVLVPLCQRLVRAHQWQRAWHLCQRIEEVPMKIRLSSEIALELDVLPQRNDAQTVWAHTSELALANRPLLYDLSDLARAFEKAQRQEQADVLWKAQVSDVLEANQDDMSLRTRNCSSLALEMAQRQHREDAETLLHEGMKAAWVLWEQRLRSRGLTYTDL